MVGRVGRFTGVVALVSAAVWLLPSSAGAGSSCPLPKFGPGPDYRPHIEPANFSPNVTNKLFPLTPGKTLVYTGTKDGKKALNLVATTSRTKVIDRVRTRVVEDRLYLNNVLEERTSDYYAQDSHGKVVSTEGSFHAGVDGAQPGVFMQAHPEVGRKFRQEWYQGQAEDVFKVISLSSPVTVPYGSFRHALRTEETTALEPGVLDNKYYVKGIGEVAELSVKGPREALRLVEVIS